MIASSSTFAFSSPDACNSFATAGNSQSHREEKPSSFDALLDQAQNQRPIDRSTHKHGELHAPSPHSGTSSNNPAGAQDDPDAESASAATDSTRPQPANDESAVESGNGSKKETNRAATNPSGVEARNGDNVTAVIALAGLAQAAPTVPGPIPVAAVPSVTAIPAPVSTSPESPAPIVPAAPVTVQSQTIPAGLAQIASVTLTSSAPAITSPGTPVDSHLGLATGSGAGQSPTTTQILRGPSAAATASEPGPISQSTSAISASSSLAGSVTPVVPNTKTTVALPSTVQTEVQETVSTAPTAPSEPARTSPSAASGAIERLLVVKERPETVSSSAPTRTEPASTQAQLAPGQNSPSSRPNLAPAQAPHNSGVANAAVTAVAIVNGVEESVAITPVTVTADPNAPLLFKAAGDASTGVVNALQGTAAKELSPKAGIQASSAYTDNTPNSSIGHEAVSAQHSDADANDHHGSRQFAEEPAPTRNISEILPPSSDAVSAPAASATGSSASAGGTSATTNANLDRFHVVEQVTRHLDSLRLKNANGEITLNLTPAHLGSVRVTISTGEHGVAARILVETSQAQQAMESAKDSLRSALETRGLNLSSLDVSLGHNASGDSWGNFARQQESAQETAGRFAGRTYSESSSADTPLEVGAAVSSLNQATGSSRLDYRA